MGHASQIELPLVPISLSQRGGWAAEPHRRRKGVQGRRRGRARWSGKSKGGGEGKLRLGFSFSFFLREREYFLIVKAHI